MQLLFVIEGEGSVHLLSTADFERLKALGLALNPILFSRREEVKILARQGPNGRHSAPALGGPLCVPIELCESEDEMRPERLLARKEAVLVVIIPDERCPLYIELIQRYKFDKSSVVFVDTTTKQVVQLGPREYYRFPKLFEMPVEAKV